MARATILGSHERLLFHLQAASADNMWLAILFDSGYATYKLILAVDHLSASRGFADGPWVFCGNRIPNDIFFPLHICRRSLHTEASFNRK